MKYAVNLLKLWITGRISGPVLLYALKAKPDAVAGRGGSYAVYEKAPSESR
jgi:hypothetical protein